MKPSLALACMLLVAGCHAHHHHDHPADRSALLPNRPLGSFESILVHVSGGPALTEREAVTLENLVVSDLRDRELYRSVVAGSASPDAAGDLRLEARILALETPLTRGMGVGGGFNSPVSIRIETVLRSEDGKPVGRFETEARSDTGTPMGLSTDQALEKASDRIVRFVVPAPVGSGPLASRALSMAPTVAPSEPASTDAPGAEPPASSTHGDDEPRPLGRLLEVGAGDPAGDPGRDPPVPAPPPGPGRPRLHRPVPGLEPQPDVGSPRARDPHRDLHLRLLGRPPGPGPDPTPAPSPSPSTWSAGCFPGRRSRSRWVDRSRSSPSARTTSGASASPSSSSPSRSPSRRCSPSPRPWWC